MKERCLNGPAVLAEDSALEFQDVLLGRKPHTELSDRARSVCQFDSHLRVVTNPAVSHNILEFCARVLA